MKRLLYVIAVLALLLGGVKQAKAGVVYSDGPINGNAGGYTIATQITAGYGYEVSDSFTVASSTSLTGAQQVGIWTFSSGSPVSVQWSIGTSPFASDVSSGVSLISSTQLTPSSSYGFGGSYNVWDSSFALSGAVNAGTTYYLTLSNATATDGNPVYWDYNGGPSSASQQSDYGYPYYAVIGAESFQLTGGAAATPEPASLTLLGLGGLSLVGYGWRRRRQSVTA